MVCPRWTKSVLQRHIISSAHCREKLQSALWLRCMCMEQTLHMNAKSCLRSWNCLICYQDNTRSLGRSLGFAGWKTRPVSVSTLLKSDPNARSSSPLTFGTRQERTPTSCSHNTRKLRINLRYGHIVDQVLLTPLPDFWPFAFAHAFFRDQIPDIKATLLLGRVTHLQVWG